MVLRTSRSLICAIAALLGAVSPALAQARGPGARFAPAVYRPAERTVAIAWVIRPADVVACETPAPELRRYQHEYGESLELTVYIVGGDTAMARSFLRSERLAGARLEQISESQFRRDFPNAQPDAAAPPVLVLSSTGTDRITLFADVRQARGRSDVDRLGSELDALLGTRTAFREAVLNNQPRRGGRP